MNEDRFHEGTPSNPERVESEKSIERLLTERDQLNVEWAELRRKDVEIHAARKELHNASISDETIRQVEQLDAESDRIRRRQIELLDRQAMVEQQIIDIYHARN